MTMCHWVYIGHAINGKLESGELELQYQRTVKCFSPSVAYTQASCNSRRRCAGALRPGIFSNLSQKHISTPIFHSNSFSSLFEAQLQVKTSKQESGPGDTRKAPESTFTASHEHNNNNWISYHHLIMLYTKEHSAMLT